jgi:hypothetical protein
MHFLFGDVNADGNADFAAGHQYGSVYLGDGNGNFTLADGNLPPGGSLGRRGPSLGDVDNDGDQDFAYCNSNGGVEVWTWQGANTWNNFSGSLPGSGPYEVTELWDMDIDGNMDVAAFGDSTVTVWLGDGAGNWTHDVTFNTPYPGYFSAFRVGADADHNGYPDIALVGEEGDGWNAINHLRFYKETSVPGSLFVFPIYPRGGETFVSGSVHFIHWTCGVPPGATASIKLELSINGSSGPWSQIVASTPNNGRYQWSIPTGISSDNCYIRYTATTAADTSVALTPSAFRISPATNIREISHYTTKSPELRVIPTIAGGNILVEISTFGLSNTFIKIYDDCGNLIRNLLHVNGSGKFRINWDRKDNNRRQVPSGVYFIRCESDKKILSKKIVIISH